MAYRKRVYRRRFHKKPRMARAKKLVEPQKTTIEKIADGVGSVAKLASAVVPLVTAINTEEKYLDYTANNTFLNGSPWIYCINQIPQGTDDQNRVGNSIKAQSMMFRYLITPNFTGQPYNHCRFMIVVDKGAQPAYSSGPTLATLLEAPTNILSPINKDYGDRFTILKDKIFSMNQGYAGNTPSYMSKEFRKLDFHIRFNGAAANQYAGNSIFFIFWTAQAVNALGATVYSRLKFTDN